MSNISMSNKGVIRDFIKAWQSLDAERLGGYFTDDGIYHNMPAEPVQGREAIVEFIKGFAGGWTATEWEVVSIVEDGELVIAERVDRIDIGEKHVDLPCVGIFEMQDGKIKIWRDYFDLGTYMKAFG